MVGPLEAHVCEAGPVHHPRGKDWKPTLVNALKRVALYERDAAQHNLEVRCRRCHTAVHQRGA